MEGIEEETKCIIQMIDRWLMLVWKTVNICFEGLGNVSQSRSDSNRSASEENELLLDVTFDSLGLNLEHVESNSLGEGSALSDGDNISFRDSWEGWGAVSG